MRGKVIREGGGGGQVGIQHMFLLVHPLRLDHLDLAIIIRFEVGSVGPAQVRRVSCGRLGLPTDYFFSFLFLFSFFFLVLKFVLKKSAVSLRKASVANGDITLSCAVMHVCMYI